MGIPVTLEATLELEVGLALVALGTFWNYGSLWGCRRVPTFVTIQTGYFCLVLTSCLLNLMDDSRMALHAIGISKFFLRGIFSG